TFTLTVTDPGNLGSSATTHVTVNAPVTNHPPVANAGPNQAIACAGQNGTVVTLNGSASSDPDNDVLSFVWKDSNGNVVGTTAIAQGPVSPPPRPFPLPVTHPAAPTPPPPPKAPFKDTTAPSLPVSLPPNPLQPPNHKLVPIYAAVSASDACSANLAV